MSDLATAYVQIIPTATGIKERLTQELGGAADASGKSSGSTFASVFGKAAGTALAVSGAAVIGAGKFISDAVADAASYGDNIDKLSQKMGLSASAFQEWEAVMQHSGTSMETMKAGMKTLANAVESGNSAFERIGITQEMLAEMNHEELFAATISGLQNVGNETERTYLAGQLLGRGATELGALLNMSAEETDAMRQRVHELGGVMSDEAVKAAAAFQDSQQDMQTAASSIVRNLASELLPGATGVMNGLTEVFSGNMDRGLEEIGTGITEIVDGFADNVLPKALPLGMQIITALLSAIISNLPMVFEIGTPLILNLTNGLISQLPEIGKAAISIILMLAQGIGENIGNLIPAAVGMIMELVTMLTDPEMIGSLVDASIAIIFGLLDGIIAAIPILIEAVPTIVKNLIVAFLENTPKLVLLGTQILFKLISGITSASGELGMVAPELLQALVAGAVASFHMLTKLGGDLLAETASGFINSLGEVWQWGKDVIVNFCQGLWDNLGRLKETLGNVAGTIKDFLGFSEPEEGPLSNFHTFAPDMMELFRSGIEQNEKSVFAAVDDVAAGVQSRFRAAAAQTMQLRGYETLALASGPYQRGYTYDPEDNRAVLRECLATLREISARMGLQVVLDDGTLIGRIDSRLGEQAARKGRGN